MKRSLVLLLALCLPPALRAQALLDDLDDALTVQAGPVRVDLSLMADTVLFVPGSAPQGTLGFLHRDVFLNPRLSLFLDAQIGSSLSAHVQMNVDRGFDPGRRPGGDARLDEYYLQWQALGDDHLVVRAGKFATVFGNWTPRHLAWDDPFITAPLAYSDVLPLTDHVAPAGLADFTSRHLHADTPGTWVPMIWGPSYATGVSISGRVDTLDYAIEMKNAALSSRPETWDAIQQDDYRTPPTITARLAWHPAPEWTLGTSFSHGPWMINQDANQTTTGIDVSYAHGHWQWWFEAMNASFEVPGLGDVHATGAFLESKYKLTSRLWLAARWNQGWFDDIGGSRWNNDTWRADLALGFRLSRHVQAKLQYSLAQDSGGNLFAAEFTVRF